MHYRLLTTLALCGATWLGSAQTGKALKTGIWRAELAVAGQHQAPFLMEVKKNASNQTLVVLMNGEERVELKGVKQRGDSIIIPVEAYDAVIKAVVKDNSMEGLFLKNFIPNDAGIPFRADYNRKNRFAPVAEQVRIPVDGKWDVWFSEGTKDASHNVGIFKTANGRITGSILTSSGDLRFLEGNYTAKGAQLSAFAGLSPYLIELSFQDKDRFTGTFYTAKGTTTLTAKRNDKAGLDDPYTLTKMKAGKTGLAFSLPNETGKKISLSDERYRGKVVIISILGSWCPNCLDEMKYLAPWYKANRARGVEVIGLAFERKDDFSYAQGTIGRLKARNAVDYEVLFAGKAGAEAVARVLPELDGFSSYPTTIFIDRKGNVRKIYTGYNGPATGLFYDEFKKEFNALIDSLLAE